MHTLVLSKRVLGGEVIARVVSEDRSQARNLSDAELERLVKLLAEAKADIIVEQTLPFTPGRID